jgi:hypothetical protein
MRKALDWNLSRNVLPWWPPASGMLWKDKHRFYIEMLQLHPRKTRHLARHDTVTAAMENEKLQWIRAQRELKGFYWGGFFCKFTIPEYYAAEVQDKQYQPQYTSQTHGKAAMSHVE